MKKGIGKFCVVLCALLAMLICGSVLCAAAESTGSAQSVTSQVAEGTESAASIVSRVSQTESNASITSGPSKEEERESYKQTILEWSYSMSLMSIAGVVCVLAAVVYAVMYKRKQKKKNKI